MPRVFITDDVQRNRGMTHHRLDDVSYENTGVFKVVHWSTVHVYTEETNQNDVIDNGGEWQVSRVQPLQEQRWILSIVECYVRHSLHAHASTHKIIFER